MTTRAHVSKDEAKQTVASAREHLFTRPSSARNAAGHQASGDVMGVAGLTKELAQQLGHFIDWMQGQGMAETTVRQRSLVIGNRLAEWGTWDVRPAVIVAWLGRYSGWTKATYFLHVRSAYKFAVEWGLVESDPTARIIRPPQPVARPRPLTAGQLNAVLDTASPQVRKFVLLAYLAGLRSHEVAKIRGEDVTEQTLTVLGKGGQQVILPTHPALWALAQEMPREGWWFPSTLIEGQPISASWVSTAVRRTLRAAGVESGSIHRVRASFGTDLLRSGANVRVVQKLMRHKSLESTERYLGVADDEMAKALGALVA